MAEDMIARANRGNDVWPAPRVDLDASITATATGLIGALDDTFSQLTVGRCAEAFRYPSAVAELMYLFMDQADDAADAARRTFVAERMLEIIDVLRSGNPFCEEGRNQLRGYHDRSPMASVRIDDAIARRLGKLTAWLNLYCEYAFFAFVAFGREIHGPYTQNPDRPEIVRDYFDLKPGFWEFPSRLPFSTISLTVAYRDCDLSFDFMGRLISHKSFPEHAVSATLSADGVDTPVTSSSLQWLLEVVSGALQDAFEETMASTDDQLLTRLATAEYWACRNVFDRSGQRYLTPPDEGAINTILDRYHRVSGHDRCKLSQTLGRIAGLEGDEKRRALKRLLSPGARGKWL